MFVSRSNITQSWLPLFEITWKRNVADNFIQGSQFWGPSPPSCKSWYKPQVAVYMLKHRVTSPFWTQDGAAHRTNQFDLLLNSQSLDTHLGLFLASYIQRSSKRLRSQENHRLYTVRHMFQSCIRHRFELVFRDERMNHRLDIYRHIFRTTARWQFQADAYTWSNRDDV